ncbi:class A beta-lactamase, subclass A2 [Dyadobacter frigoris]|uniref:Beta-lactamase n=1 Tax=Dyadobacter frigoris TaxID=2576211 RepID=A0A4V6BLT4_9BACT|nr:class A beta-lactamase, subclass A2 [Dyadobacter frigoris]TKT91643.1 class A beta-lactamase, subclass A2 [Dyadobacter frigoris]GLU51793.1 CepA family class A extended-spectrum beta-lactamase [Dyadobacter frigoris]
MTINKNFKSSTFFLIAFFLVSNLNAFAQKKHEIFRQEIDKIISASKSDVGVAIMGLEDKETFLFNEGHKYPMQSVYKFPLAMAVLDQVDKGKLSLNQKIHVTKKDLLPKTWSPLREKYPNGGVDIKISELIGYAVSNSDNNACDILFRTVGGPEKVDQYIHGLGIKSIAIAATEEEMSKSWNVQFTNWCKPRAMLRLLDLFYKGKNLSKTSTNFLMKTMTETTTGPNKIKGLLPKNTKVAHKTGLSGTNEEGILAASNDVGIITLPNGEHVAVVIFLAHTKLDEKSRDGVIAQISKEAYDYFLAKK